LVYQYNHGFFIPGLAYRDEVLIAGYQLLNTSVVLLTNENGYDLYEFESSKLTNIHTHKIMPGSLFGYNEKCSFGELNFDLSLEDPQLKYSIINIDGELIDSIFINSSKLKYINDQF
jgi:hypothetical protein